MYREEAIAYLVAELDRAQEMFPRFQSKHEGYAVILEELDELWETIKSKTMTEEQILDEATHVAAMATRFLIDCC